MNKVFLTIVLIFLGTFFTAALKAQTSLHKPRVKGQDVFYSANGVKMKGYIAYDSSLKAERPCVLVVHEWWGCNEYARKRARMLAELGYFALAVDMYGDGKLATDPKTASEYATPFYQNPLLAKERLEAALLMLKNYPETNYSRVSAIGYCFGGCMVLNAAKLGMNFNSVVSFHGGLDGVEASKGLTKANIMVCHGEADQFVSKDEVNKFKQNLDTLKVPYQFITYPNATHAFTNPEATATGKKFSMPIQYNAAADKKSWNDMKLFLAKGFKR